MAFDLKQREAVDASEHHPANGQHWQKLGWRLEIADAADLARLDAGRWDVLSRSALEENPYYARQYVLAGLETIDRRKPVRAFTVSDEANRLVGLIPYYQGIGTAESAQNVYQFSGVPLIDRNRATTVLTAWLESIADGSLPSAAILRNLRLDGETSRKIQRLAADLRLSSRQIGSYSRPRLTRAFDNFESHRSAVLSTGRRRELERAIRRMKEIGNLRLQRMEQPDDVRTYLQVFLSLELSGWKGSAGTALAAHPETEAFARKAFGGASGREGLASIDVLFLGEKPIAVSVNIACGSTLFTPKGAYDEALRRFSPGLVLEYMIIQKFYQDAACSHSAMDSSTTVDGHVVQGLWNEVVPMGTLVVGRPGAVAAVAKLDQAHWRALAWAKQMRSRIMRTRGREPERDARV